MKTIYTDKKTALKLALFMCVAFSIAWLSKKSIDIEFILLIISTFAIFQLIFLAFRITYSAEEIKQYRLFFFFTRIKTKDIVDIKYMPFSRKGRARVLELKMKNRRISDIYIAMYSIESANELISFVRQNNNITTPLKAVNNKSIFLSKKNKTGIILFFIPLLIILLTSILLKSH